LACSVEQCRLSERGGTVDGDDAPDAVEIARDESHTYRAAPMALYPDPLVAQVFAAATWPARSWRRIAGSNRTGPSIRGCASARRRLAAVVSECQSEITQFPAVLGMMDWNLSFSYLSGGRRFLGA